MRFKFLCLIMICTSLSVLAQDRGYHVAMTDGPKMPNGTVLKQVILVNDSQKFIEAYDAQVNCWNGDVRKTGTVTSFDALLNPGATYSRLSADGTLLVNHGAAVAPGERSVTGLPVNLQSSECEWKAEVDTVIYTDGSYDGDKEAARSIEARRDGIMASVKDWVIMLNQVDTLGPEISTATQNLLTIKAEVQGRLDKDVVSCKDQPSACKYWMGRYGIDYSLSQQTRPVMANETPDHIYQRVTQFIVRLDKKIQDDTALKILDGVFPLSPTINSVPGSHSPN
jgi:hypothetical protein